MEVFVTVLFLFLIVLIVLSIIKLIRNKPPWPPQHGIPHDTDPIDDMHYGLRDGVYRDPYSRYSGPSVVVVEERPPLVFVDVERGVEADVTVPDSTGFSGFGGGDSGGAGASSDWGGGSDTGSCDSGSFDSGAFSDSGSCDSGGGF